jgi:hypothetical protein
MEKHDRQRFQAGYGKIMIMMTNAYYHENRHRKLVCVMITEEHDTRRF